MKTVAKLHIGAILLLGASALFNGFAGWSCDNPWKFCFYLCAAVITSAWRVRLPGIRDAISASTLYVLVGVVELSLGEATALAGGATLWQTVQKAKLRAKPVRVALCVASAAVAAYLAHGVFHAAAPLDLSFEFPLQLAAAVVVYFAANTYPVSASLALTSGRNLVRIWKGRYLSSLAYYLCAAACSGPLHLLNSAFGWQASLLVVPVIYLVYRSYSLYLVRLKHEKLQSEIERAHAEEMAALHLRTIEALALAIEAKDQTTHDHLRRVEVYCMEMARILNLTEQERRALQAASLLHDIGKLAVPEHILSKPGRLTQEEFEKIKLHPVIGAQILERVRFPYPVVPIVRHHHEHWDGNGYPEGLSGEQIPIGARILAVADCLDALASERQYRRALPLMEALEAVDAESGRTYDPQVVQVLKRHYVEMEERARSSCGNGVQPKDYKVDRAVVPAAGFETGHEPLEIRPTAFLNTIGAARREARLLFEAAQAMVLSSNLSEMLDQLTSRLRALIEFDAMAVYLTRGHLLETVYASGSDAPLFRSLGIPLGQGLSGWVAESGRPIRNGNPSVEPGYLNSPEVYSVHRSALAVPLEGSSGILGTLTLYSRNGDAFTKDDLRVLVSISSKLGLAIENGLRVRDAEDAAHTDYLTGLPNARALFIRLHEELHNPRGGHGSGVVLLADLDGFKSINGKYGHLTGNSLLKAVSEALLSECRDTDFVARMGGDEIAIVCPDMPTSVALNLSGRLRRAVQKAGRRALGKDLLSVSIGIATYPEDGAEPDVILAEADRKMQENKELSRQRQQSLWTLAEAVAHDGSNAAAQTLPSAAEKSAGSDLCGF